ncbi:hypothetical protein NC651_036489 [Populus alba x Populus x berolinensis]|nr:hypothetical protein NC651_036489 [Populus alba x Populus x berolinensis]
MVTRLVKIFENLKNNRQYFVLSSLRGSVGFPGCLKRPFKVSELEYSAFLYRVVATDMVSPSNGDNSAEMRDDSCFP